MELILKFFILCILSAIFAMLLREQKQILAFFVILTLALIAIPFLFEGFQEIFSFFNEMIALSALPSKVYDPLIKVIGIAAVTKIGTSLCKEAESDTAAVLLEMCGTCCALIVSLPLMTMVLELLKQMV